MPPPAEGFILVYPKVGNHYVDIPVKPRVIWTDFRTILAVSTDTEFDGIIPRIATEIYIAAESRVKAEISSRSTTQLTRGRTCGHCPRHSAATLRSSIDGGPGNSVLIAVVLQSSLHCQHKTLPTYYPSRNARQDDR